MITPEKFAAVTGAIEALCEAHGVVIVGTCESEGIFGEIKVIEFRETTEGEKECAFNFEAGGTE